MIDRKKNVKCKYIVATKKILKAQNTLKKNMMKY